MIYDVLERDFLKKTSRYKYNRTIKRIFFIANFIIIIYWGIIIFLNYLNIEKLMLFFWIGFLVWVFFTYYIITESYPEYYYKKHKKDNIVETDKKTLKERLKYSFNSQKIINSKIKEMLFESSVNDLVILLKKEKLDSKAKLKVVIEHYERIQTSKIPLVFPYLVVLSIIISIISLYFSIGEMYREDALICVGIAIICLTIIVAELKFSRFVDKKMFNTPEKYDYLLMLLTEIYLKRFRGNYLPIPNDN